MFSKHRVEALSDGVFAVAMTLLVIDLKVPADVAPGQLGAAIRAGGHEWVSFIITFVLAAVFWASQHRVLDAVDEVSNESLGLTFLFLAGVSVLPFTTSLWGHHIKEPLAFVLYFLNQFAMAAALTAKLELARLKGHVREGAAVGLLQVRLYSTCAVMAVSAAAVWYLPWNYWWIVLAFAGLVSRAVRWMYLRETSDATETPSITG